MKTSNDYKGYTPIHVQYILLILKDKDYAFVYLIFIANAYFKSIEILLF